MIVTKQNRPPAPQTENLDATQDWNGPSNGRCNAGDTRFSEHASGGKPKWHPQEPQTSDDEASDTAETGINPAAPIFEDEIPADGEAGSYD